MKKYIRLKNGKLFIRKQAMWILAGVCVTILCIGLIFARNMFVTSQVQTTRPLGVAPKGAEKVKQSTIEASKFLINTIKEEHKHKLVIIFYYDNYDVQDVALRDAKNLSKVLEQDPFKNLSEFLTFKIITSGRICNVVDKNLVCEPRHIEALQKLGIDHIKIVVLHPEEFDSVVNYGYGADSVITLPTKQKDGESEIKFLSRIKQIFKEKLLESLSADLQKGNREEYLAAVFSCFYGGKESYKIKNQGFLSCRDFKTKYPKFWEHDVK